MAYSAQLRVEKSFRAWIRDAVTGWRTPIAGARIANSRGVPGTLGCFGRTRDGQRVVLGSWHVLFGHGASEQGSVWMIEGRGGRRCVCDLGRSLRGAIGTISIDGEQYYVDCAIASATGARRTLFGRSGWMPVGSAIPGEAVRKIGAGTGLTLGTVVDVAYPDVASIENRVYAAPRQILIRAVHGPAFSAEGDSGAAVVNRGGQVVGLLWGTTARGEGVACHIEPVLRALDISLVADGVGSFWNGVSRWMQRRRGVPQCNS